MNKPRLSFWQIWNMSFGFLGIQFGFALQNANVSRIFQTLGANIDDIPILWIAAPITGLIVQPIIGYLSDRTWNRLGRRRPYFLIGALFASLALFIMPNSPTLWIAAGMLWIMDASINISMEPFRAFVGDNLPDEQRTSGFAMQSFFIGTGAVVASMLPYVLANWFGVANEAPAGIIPDSVKWSFYLGGSIFFLAVLWTVVRSFEYSPKELEAFGSQELDYQLESWTPAQVQANAIKQQRIGMILILLGATFTWSVANYELAKELYVLGGGVILFGILLLISWVMQGSGEAGAGFSTMINDLMHMPRTMRQLAWVQFFSWFALFAMWIYT
ncbi:MAG: MFS transporter, partial [Saprospiraceae bacterium]|nr:MFS transporter [Saprospiraceae bacterium]